MNQILQGGISDEVRKHSLCKPDLKLDDLMIYARSLETSKRQIAQMSSGAGSQPQNQSASVNNISAHKKRGAQSCRNCGGYIPHQNECPAKHAACNFCKITSHFERVCRKKAQNKAQPNHSKLSAQSQRKPHFNKSSQRKVYAIDDSSDTHAVAEPHSDDDYIGYVFSVNEKSAGHHPFADIKIQDTYFSMMIDSGSCLNIIDEIFFRDLSLHKTVLKPCDKKLRGYGGTVIPALGQFRDVLHSADKSITTDFVVVKGDHGNLLSGQTANTLGLLHLSRSHVNTVSDKLVKYPILKQGIGKLNDRWYTCTLIIQFSLHASHNIGV